MDTDFLLPPAIVGACILWFVLGHYLASRGIMLRLSHAFDNGYECGRMCGVDKVEDLIFALESILPELESVGPLEKFEEARRIIAWTRKEFPAVADDDNELPF